jgi:pyrrolidone-carboxylate peptidase
MHWVAAQKKRMSAGFIHLPALPEQAARSSGPMPSLPLDYFTRAALLIIDTIILHT